MWHVYTVTSTLQLRDLTMDILCVNKYRIMSTAAHEYVALEVQEVLTGDPVGPGGPLGPIGP